MGKPFIDTANQRSDQPLARGRRRKQMAPRSSVTPLLRDGARSPPPQTCRMPLPELALKCEPVLVSRDGFTFSSSPRGYQMPFFGSRQLPARKSGDNLELGTHHRPSQTSAPPPHACNTNRCADLLLSTFMVDVCVEESV